MVFRMFPKFPILNVHELENKIMEEKEFGSRYAVNPSDSIIWENSYSPDAFSNGCNFGYQNNKILTTELKIGSEKKYSTDSLSQNYENLQTSLSSGIDKISIRISLKKKLINAR
ncbi:unnamed protein product [Brachionus calyciflorus]|uniref:Uncharacterized protein n=1 Tax=Brachionus calyciflorus TaxID=104777 RepID=A0A813XV78_9BILA|nr:unnamed protein product [Brachionus calyciflorus]